MVPNAHLLLLLPLIGTGVFIVSDTIRMLLGRHDPRSFPEGPDRLIWAFLLTGVGRGVVFGLFFGPAIYIVMLANQSLRLGTLGMALCMLPVLFVGGLFVGWVESAVFHQLDSPLLRDRKEFLAGRMSAKKRREVSR